MSTLHSFFEQGRPKPKSPAATAKSRVSRAAKATIQQQTADNPLDVVNSPSVFRMRGLIDTSSHQGSAGVSTVGGGFSSPSVGHPAASPGQARKSLGMVGLLNLQQRYEWICLPKQQDGTDILYSRDRKVHCKLCDKDVHISTERHAQQHAAGKKHRAKENPPPEPDNVNGYTANDRRDACVVALVLAGTPYQGVQYLRDVKFDKLIAKAPELPCRQTVPSIIIKHNTDRMPQIIQQLLGSDLIVIAVDESTSSRLPMDDAPRVIAAVAISLNSGRHVCLHVCNITSATAKNVAATVKSILAKGGLQPAQMWGAITDNASTMGAFVDCLKQDSAYAHVRQLRCAAHILNIQVKSIMSAVPDLQSSLKSIQSVKSRGAEAYIKLKLVADSTIYCGTDTRWTYYLDAIAHMLESSTVETADAQAIGYSGSRTQKRWYSVQQALQSVSASSAALTHLRLRLADCKLQLHAAVCDVFFTSTRELLVQLQFTDCLEVQKSRASLASSKGYAVATELDEQLQEWLNMNEHQRAKRMVKEACAALDWCINVHTQDIEQLGGAVALTAAEKDEYVAALLPQLRKVKASVQANYTPLMRRVVKAQILASPDHRNVVLMSQSIGDHGPRADPGAWMIPRLVKSKPALLHTAFVRYLDRDVEAVLNTDLLNFWSQYAVDPMLANYSVRLLRLPLTSTSVERVFSLLTHMDSDNYRNRLLSDSAMAELTLKANKDINTQWITGVADAKAPEPMRVQTTLESLGSKRARAVTIDSSDSSHVDFEL